MATTTTDAIFTQAEMELAALLGKKFGNTVSAMSIVDMIRHIADLDLSRPYNAMTVVAVTERLFRYGYSDTEAYEVVWAIRERQGI